MNVPMNELPPIATIRPLPVSEVRRYAALLGFADEEVDLWRVSRDDTWARALRRVMTFMRLMWLQQDPPYSLRDFDTPERLAYITRLLGSKKPSATKRRLFFQQFRSKSYYNRIVMASLNDALERAGMDDDFFAGELRESIVDAKGKDKVPGLKLLKEVREHSDRGIEEDYSKYLPGGALPAIEDASFEDSLDESLLPAHVDEADDEY